LVNISLWQRHSFGAGKERDKESGLGDNDGYDYFGARYYNSRIANWTSIDPLFEKHYSYSPYNYVLRIPLILVDPDGLQVSLHTYELSDENLSSSSNYRAIGESAWNEYSREKLKKYGPFQLQEGLLEPEVIDPVDILTGLAMAKLSFKLAEKFVFKESTKLASETLPKEVGKETFEYTLPKFAKQLEKQLANDGSSTIFTSLRSFEKRLAEHMDKVGTLTRKSSVEREIRGFKKSIETLKQFIKEKGLKE